MTKKEHFQTHPSIGYHFYYNMYLHDYDGKHAWISRIYQPVYCGKKAIALHKLSVKCDAMGDPYVTLIDRWYDGKKVPLRIYLNDFNMTALPRTLDEIKEIFHIYE